MVIVLRLSFIKKTLKRSEKTQEDLCLRIYQCNNNNRMIIKLKSSKNYKQPKKSKRKMQTQPLQCESEEEAQVAINAKNYLIDLNTNQDSQYSNYLLIKHKSEVDVSLSQWSIKANNDYRLSQRIPKSNSIHVSKLDERKISNKQFSSIEMSLIDQHIASDPFTMRITNLSRFMQGKDSIRTNPSPEQQIKIKKFSSNIQNFEVGLPPRSRVISLVVKQEKTTKVEGPPKIDINYVQKTSSDTKSFKFKQKLSDNRNRLPRLDHLQSQQHKNKYKSIFRVSNRKNVMLFPTHSPISKDLSKIDDLIREESIKLIKKPT